MHTRVPARYRRLLFALLMSLTTSLLVSAIILLRHGVAAPVFFAQWMQAVSSAWPVVFAAILLIAPRIDRVLDRFVEKS